MCIYIYIYIYVCIHIHTSTYIYAGGASGEAHAAQRSAKEEGVQHTTHDVVAPGEGQLVDVQELGPILYYTILYYTIL